MPLSTILVSPGPVTTLTLNRPDLRNAFNDVMIGELTEWASSLPADGSVRAVVIKGAGPSFCAGADLQWMSKMANYTREENLEDARRAAKMLLALDSLAVPLIGRIHGAALGGGAGLAAICDVAIADEDTVFGFTETALGLLPAMIAPYVVRRIGLSAARVVCLSGEKFSAKRAKKIGLVHDVVPAAELDATIEELLQQFRKAAPSAVAATKRLLAEITGRRPADVVDVTADAIAAQRVSPEGQEGIRAFLERRPASWTK